MLCGFAFLLFHSTFSWIYLLCMISLGLFPKKNRNMEVKVLYFENLVKGLPWNNYQNLYVFLPQGEKKMPTLASKISLKAFNSFSRGISFQMWWFSTLREKESRAKTECSICQMFWWRWRMRAKEKNKWKLQFQTNSAQL